MFVSVTPWSGGLVISVVTNDLHHGLILLIVFLILKM